MCGIAGFLNLSKNNFKVDEDLLNLMQEKLNHRGPDGFGIWKSDEHQIGLAHRRLSIIDLSQVAFQPMLDKALSDSRVDALIVPIGKGELVCRKKEFFDQI